MVFCKIIGIVQDNIDYPVNNRREGIIQQANFHVFLQLFFGFSHRDMCNASCEVRPHPPLAAVQQSWVRHALLARRYLPREGKVLKELLFEYHDFGALSRANCGSVFGVFLKRSTDFQYFSIFARKTVSALFV